MTDAEYIDARRRVIAGEDPPPALIEECRRCVGLLVHSSGLPPHYSPYGIWSAEAVDEVFADWLAVRAVERGQLLAMLQRAPQPRVFRRMVETSVRQHLIDGLARSQAHNLFGRATRLLSENERFRPTGSGGGRLWSLTDGPADPFDGDDRQLLGLAYSLGDFDVIRYDPEARKLSPLLASADLERFIGGLLAAGGAMSAATIVRALRLRFGLDDDEAPQELPDSQPALPGADPEQEVLIDELLTATLAELTDRQARVLDGLGQGHSGRELAASLGCSAATISHERRQIEQILIRLGVDAPHVLQAMRDANPE